MSRRPGENTDQPAETPTAAVQPPPVLNPGDDCPDSTLAVKGLTNAPQYAIGDQPKFVMVVTNIGLVACKRDVGAAVLAAYVYSLDNKRLWSNLDCAPSNETLVKTFAPGEQVTTAVTWTGMGSAPHCPLPRPAIGPGTYNLVVQLGNLRSLAVPFILAPPLAPGAAPPPARIARPDAWAAARPRAGSRRLSGCVQLSESPMVDSANCDKPSRTWRAQISPMPSTASRSPALAASRPCSEPNSRTSRSAWANWSRGISDIAR